MDKKLLIDSYLQGKRPIEHETWSLPSESELDRDEALYDALLAERRKASLLNRKRWGWLLAAAAVVVAVLTSLTWKSFMPSPQPQLVAEENTTRREVNHDTPKSQAQHVEKSSTTRRLEKHDVRTSESSHEKLAKFTREVDKVHTRSLKTSPQDSAEASQPAANTLVLNDAADSLYYYLTQLENQMGDCRDSTCLAELTGLMRADERIKDLVNKIINKQVETAYQEEYLVDTTTRYIPL